MNISEFANYAGVSKSAVSRYFNKGYLSEDKRIKIEEAIEETGYAPSASAQSVRTRVTKLVGVILPKLSSESTARVVEGISQVLGEEGYELLLVNTANDYNKEIAYLDLFRQNRVDGVIFLASVFTRLHKSVLNKMHIPVIIVGQNYRGFNCVCHDDLGASYSITKKMIEKGGKVPGYIGVTTDDEAVGGQRFNGFMKALEDSGVKIMDKNMAVSEFSMDSGYECAGKILSEKNEKRPDFIFCATDTISSGVMQYSRENNISIPDQLMIASIGDSKMGKIMYVPLTSVHLHYKTSGIEAAQMLISAIKRNDSVPRTLCLDYEIIERESTNRKM